MIRILSGGYTKEDFEFLQKILSDSIQEVNTECFNGYKRCVYCQHRRACLDISEVVDYLGKEVSRK